jgi:hypothetical protein
MPGCPNTRSVIQGLEAKRDLVSVLVKANMSPSLPESQRLTHTEVIARSDAPDLASSHEAAKPKPWLDKPRQTKSTASGGLGLGLGVAEAQAKGSSHSLEGAK